MNVVLMLIDFELMFLLSSGKDFILKNETKVK